MWLAQINLTPNMRKNNPEAVERLLKYQLEAADVLHKAFYVTEEQKERLHSELGLEGKIEDIQIQITDIREKLGEVVDNIILTTVQQGKLQRAVKNRVNYLLGGAHSKAYKDNSKLYFINLWNDVKAKFECGSRWQDLNPICFDDAIRFIQSWEYVEN